MKKQAYTMIALLVLVGSMAVAAQAQGGSRTQLVATIPFEFSIGDKTMPAGEYTVRQVNPSSDRAVLQLRNQDGKASAMVQMNALIDKAKAQETASLIFNHYGNKYFFAQAWIPGNDGLEASKTRAERATRNEMASLKPRTEAVALISR